MIVRRQDLRGLLTLLAINVFISFLPGVSLLGHLGGLVAGALTAGDPGRDPPPSPAAGRRPGGVRRPPARRDAHRADAGRPTASRTPVGVERAQRPGHLVRIGAQVASAEHDEDAVVVGPGRGVQLEGPAAHPRAGGSPGPARAAPARAGAGRPVQVRTSTPSGPAVSRGRARTSRAARTSSSSAPAPDQHPARRRRGRRARGRGRGRPPRGPPSRRGGGTTARSTASQPGTGRHAPHPERDRPLRREPLARGHRRACRPRSGRVNGRRHPCRHGPSSRGTPSRHIHSWVHSWGQTHTGVVTGVAVPSHASHRRRNRRSEWFGSVPSLHTRWTTLGVERHVDLWTKRSSVHSVVPGNDDRPPPPEGARACGRARAVLSASAST